MNRQRIPLVNRAFARHLVFDAMIVIAGAVLAVIVIDARHQASQREIAINNTRSSVRVLQANIDLHAALERDSIDGVTFPETIETLWFEEEIPTNQLLDGGSRWVEIAAEDERGLRHPRNPTVDGGEHAMFWYNPTLGIVRARVPRTLSDAEAVAIYNEINGTRLNELTALSGRDDRE
ncbi:MAG: hypothetical protein JNL80_07170 [Phycisphaerae bacterium]|nr:hypothetical protein [Phycisphaerae bacterium]